MMIGEVVYHGLTIQILGMEYSSQEECVLSI
jgi:hypothetical protein